LANDLINSPIPPTPKTVLIYLLGKPITWRVKPHDLCKQLGLSAYAVKKALRWLCAAGFAAYSRLKSGHTIWRVFDKPQTEAAYSPAITPQVEIPQVAFRPVIVITETEEKNKPLPAPPDIQESIVVVDGVIYPEQLNPAQKKAAKHIIKKVKQPELQQPVLFALAYALTQHKVKSAPAYLQGLVTRANNGTFEPVGAASATKPDTRHIDQTQELLKARRAKTPPAPEKAKGFIQQAKSALRGAI
jgi:hypothetical protein